MQSRMQSRMPSRMPEPTALGSAAMDRYWLAAAIDLSRRSPVTPARYAVGAIVVGADGAVLASGWTGLLGPAHHAEEAALADLATRPPADLSGATIYTSLEPCSTRRSRPASCTQLILDAGIGRVVLALREPALLADCDGVRLLREAGVEVVELTALADDVRRVNAHLLAAA